MKTPRLWRVGSLDAYAFKKSIGELDGILPQHHQQKSKTLIVTEPMQNVYGQLALVGFALSLTHNFIQAVSMVL
jgi:hypothetical protein